MTGFDRDYSHYTVRGYPVKHRQKDTFPPQPIRLPSEYRETIKAIRMLDRQLNEMILGSDDYLGLVEEAYASNIHWSVHLEGNPLTEEEVKEATRRFTRRLEQETSNGPTQEVLNHLYMFFDRNAFAMPWSLDTVRSVHRLLMKGVDEEVVPGQMRNETRVEAATYGPDGFEYFDGCPAVWVEKETQSLLDWLTGAPYDELVTAVLFFHEFESIHPFADGNGRTGRTLFQLLMQTLGLKNCGLCKFECEMLRDRERYYTLLAYTDETADYTPLIMYTADAVLRAYRAAVTEFSAKDRIKDLDEASKVLARQAKAAAPFTVTDAAGWVSGISAESVRKKLEMLVEMGILTKEGRTRASRYRFRDPFREVRDRVAPIAAEMSVRRGSGGHADGGA